MLWCVGPQNAMVTSYNAPYWFNRILVTPFIYNCKCNAQRPRYKTVSEFVVAKKIVDSTQASEFHYNYSLLHSKSGTYIPETPNDSILKPVFVAEPISLNVTVRNSIDDRFLVTLFIYRPSQQWYKCRAMLKVLLSARSN